DTERPATLLHRGGSERTTAQARFAQERGQRRGHDVGNADAVALQIRLKDSQVMGVESTRLIAKPALALQVVEEVRRDHRERRRAPHPVTNKSWHQQAQ